MVWCGGGAAWQNTTHRREGRMMITYATVHPLIRAEVQETYDPDDPYGTTQGWAYAVADLIYYETCARVPMDWVYGPGSSELEWDEDEDEDSYELRALRYLHQSGRVTDNDLVAFGYWLDMHLRRTEGLA